MRDSLSFGYEDNDFRSYLYDNIGIIKVKKNVFEIVTDLSESGGLFSVFNRASAEPEIDALLLLNEPGCFSEKEFDDFLNKVAKHQADEKTSEKFSDVSRSLLRARQRNILNHFISMIVDFEKPIIIGLNGSVVTPFFGTSLAADFRFGSQNMEFSLSHLKRCIYPSGALPFFLPKYIGQAKATELLFKGGTINTDEALNLNLINYVFPEKDFENLCIKQVEELTKLNSGILNCTRRLLHSYGKELENYFHHEEKVIHI